MKKEYKIIPPAETDEDRHPVDDLLIPLNFRLLMVASSKSGKGVVLNNLLSSEFPYLKIFNGGKNIFLFSTSYSLGDKSLTNLQEHIPPENCFDTLDLDVLRELKEEARRNIIQFGKDKCPSVLLVFDDILTSVNNNKTNDIVRELWFSGRHYNFSCIMCIQLLRGISRAVRTNSTHLLIWGVENTKERKTLEEEMPCDSKLFVKILDHATSIEPYSFLKVNLKERDKNKRFQLRFTNQYYQIDN